MNAGSALRDKGIADALERATRLKSEYVESCLDAIKEFPKGALITSEDIREKAGDPPSEISPNCMAGIMKRAASGKYGLLMITNETRTATRSSLHAKRLSVWLRL